MTLRKKIKIFQRALARQGMYFSYRLINTLPYGLVRWIMRIFFVIGFVFLVRHKRVARETLRMALRSETTAAQREEILKKCFANLGWGMIEMIYFLAHPQLAKEKVVIEGQEHLQKAFTQGKGVVAVTAHFGNFPLMYLRLAVEGYKVNSIIRPARDAEIEKFLYNKRKSLGIETVYSQPRIQCVNESLRVLKNNELLFILLDQHFGSSGGVFVDFFGRKSATATGPVVLAKRTGAAIVLMFIVREQGDRYRIIIEPQVELESCDDNQEMLKVNIAKITRIIEQYVRRYPHEWGWMHRRWKGESQIS